MACITVLRMLAGADQQFFPTALVALFAYAMMPVVCPSCRFDPSMPICPRNLALFIYFVHLVALPLLINFVGPAEGVLPKMPSYYHITIAIILEILAFISFCVSYQISANRLPIANRENQGPRDESGLTRFCTAVCLAVGGMGLWCSFGSVESLCTYYMDPTRHKMRIDEQDGTLVGAAGTFFKPFLGFAFVLIWCHWVDQRARSSSFGHCLRTTATMAVLVLFGYSTFNYNRGSFVAPLIAMAGVFLARIQRLPLALILGIGSIVFSFVLLLGVYRSGRMNVQEFSAETKGASHENTQNVDINSMLQVYGAAPQFLGFLIEQNDDGHLYWGRTLLSSLMFPIPIIGKSFRATSGVVIYNEMIYGNTGVLDQIIPFEGELFMNFHLLGIVVGYGILGHVAFRLQRAFEQSSSAIKCFISIYTAYWILFLIQGALAVVSQIFVYSFWPICFYFISKLIFAGMRRA
ncbi:MAG TPA: hypothetical protein VKA15_12395 [Isosphaeraceae bacterium]|nr:hypothetical protein [Isosphaeraceae bacterium]